MVAEQLQTLIHTWDLIEEQRVDLALVGSVRLDPATNTVKLKADANGNFPTTGDHYVVTPVFNPGACRQWVGFQADIVHIKDGFLGNLTGDGFRLHDGTDQWWWNPDALPDPVWEITTTEWSPEIDIANHIAEFEATSRKLRIVIRLTTSDKTVTPSLYRAKVAWKGRVFWMEDLLYRSLARYLKNIHYSTDVAFKVAFPGGLTMNVGNIIDKLGIPFNVVDCEGVFNQDEDEDGLDNLLSGYNTSTRVATLSSAVPVGNFARVRLIVEPEITIESTSYDYTEVAKVPAIVVQDIEDVDSSPLAQPDSVVNKDTGDLIRLPPPYRFDVRFSMIALAPGGTDLARMKAAIVEYLERNPTLRSYATDRPHTIQMLDEFNIQTRPNSADLNSSRSTLIIKDVLAFNKPAVVEKAITTLVLGGDVDTQVP